MDKRSLRHLLYRRLRWLWPVLANAWTRRLLRLAGWGLVIGYFAFACLILVLRYAVLPGIGQYQGDIEAAASRAIGQKVRIGHLGASWDGLNPHLTLADVAVTDAQGRQTFAFTQVDTVLSWDTLWRFTPTLALLEVRGPVLHVRRDTAGRITIAGVDAEGESDPAVAEWIFDQHHIRIRDAMVVWEDAQRGAPPLILEDLQFGLDNRGSRHSFGFSAAPPDELADRLDIRGEFRGSMPLGGEALVARANDLRGKIYVSLNYADLAGWQPWLDYPVALPSGRGALRFWGDWNEGEWQATADVALADLRVRLAPELPELALNELRGRLAGRHRDGQWAVDGQRVTLTAMDGLHLAPIDLHADWRRESQGRPPERGRPGQPGGSWGPAAAGRLPAPRCRQPGTPGPAPAGWPPGRPAGDLGHGRRLPAPLFPAEPLRGTGFPRRRGGARDRGPERPGGGQRKGRQPASRRQKGGP